MRQHIPAHLSPSSNIDQCTAATYASGTLCQHTGSHLSYPSGSHTFINVDFRNCYPSNDHGGAIKCTGSNTELIVTGCTFTNCHVSNPSTNRGGGIYADSIKSVTTQSCFFTSCSAHWGGGLYINGVRSTPIFSHCVFISCKGLYVGGGAFVGSCTKTSCFTACSDCIFMKGTNVSATSNYWGGGLYLNIITRNDVSSLSNILFTKNSATAKGGGLRIYEHIYGLDYTVQFCYFSGNTASSGGNDISFENISTNGILHSFTTSNSGNRLIVIPDVKETSSSSTNTSTPNWLPSGILSSSVENSSS